MPTSTEPFERFGLGKRGYFQILEQAHEGSRPPSPTLGSRTRTPTPLLDDDENDDIPAKGYYERYFREECRLGMGAVGSVYLATHIIGGNVLGVLRAFGVEAVTKQARVLCGEEDRRRYE